MTHVAWPDFPWRCISVLGYLLSQVLCQGHSIYFSHLILEITLWGRCVKNPFKEEKTDNWMRYITCPNIHSQSVLELAFKTNWATWRVWYVLMSTKFSDKSPKALTIHPLLIYCFYWHIVDLQCVSFWCVAKWFCFIHTHTRTYKYSFSDSFPLQFITRYWIWFPVLYSRSLLFIYFIYSSVYLLILNS